MFLIGLKISPSSSSFPSLSTFCVDFADEEEESELDVEDDDDERLRLQDLSLQVSLDEDDDESDEDERERDFFERFDVSEERLDVFEFDDSGRGDVILVTRSFSSRTSSDRLFLFSMFDGDSIVCPSNPSTTGEASELIFSNFTQSLKSITTGEMNIKIKILIL